MAQALLRTVVDNSSAPLSQTGEKVLSVQGLGKRWGENRVLDNVSFDLHAGEMVAVIGRSGAGKSTLLHMLNGTIDASEGAVYSLRDGEPQRNLLALNSRQLRQWRSECGMI